MADRFSPAPRLFSRNTVIAGSVVLFHVAALWALQSGLLRKTVEIVVPVQLLSEFIDPPKPVEPPPPPPPPPARASPPQSEPRPQVVRRPPPPRPLAIREPRPTPAPSAPAMNAEPPSPAPAAVPSPPAPPAPPVAPPAPPAPPAVQLPSTNADYLRNPKPVYPAMSKRLGEQGKTIVRVLISSEGLPLRSSIQSSSGYERLDDAARQAVMSWRFVPGKRNGVAEDMEFSVPINWILN